MDVTEVPVFIVTRDRVRDLRRLVCWLEAVGQQRLVFLDNDSTWEPLLNYFDRTPHEVVHLDNNVGSRCLWECDQVPDGPYIVTDPDVVPVEECPDDALGFLAEALERQPGWTKAGLGLDLRGVDSHHAIDWERSLVSPERELAPHVYRSLVDTTLALYTKPWFTYEALRTGHPYVMAHDSWTAEPDEEDRYYLDHARGDECFSSWAGSLEQA